MKINKFIRKHFGVFLFKSIISLVLADLIINNDDKDFAYNKYKIKDFYNKTNYTTGDNITIVIDDILLK